MMSHYQVPMSTIKYFLISALLVCSINTLAAEKPSLPAVPDFFLEGPSNTMVRLSDLKGQVILINFWATWCRPCRIEMPVLENLYQHYKDDGLAILGINIENASQSAKREAIDAMISKMKLSFPILYDSDKNVMRNIEKHLLNKNMGMPTTLLIDRFGNTRHIHEGYRQGDDKTYQQMIEFLLKEPSKKLLPFDKKRLTFLVSSD